MPPLAASLPIMLATEDRPPAQPPQWFWRLLAGIDAGALAALAVLAWFAVHARLLREPWWAKFNLAAAPLFGERVFYMGPGRATVAGAALLFILYTLLGVVFAFLAGNRGPVRAFLLALLLMTLWQFFAQSYLWPRLDPYAVPYFLWPATIPAHAAAAVLLARFPSRLHRLQALAAPEVPSAPPPAAPTEPHPLPAAGVSNDSADDSPPSGRPSSPDC